MFLFHRPQYLLIYMVCRDVQEVRVTFLPVNVHLRCIDNPWTLYFPSCLFLLFRDANMYALLDLVWNVLLLIVYTNSCINLLIYCTAQVFGVEFSIISPKLLNYPYQGRVIFELQKGGDGSL